MKKLSIIITVLSLILSQQLLGVTVTWNNNETLTTEDYTNGEQVTIPTAPTPPAGYYFVGWSATKIADNTTSAGSGDMLFNSCEGNNETDLSKEDYDEWGW